MGHVIDPLITCVLCYKNLNTTLYEGRKKMKMVHPDDPQTMLIDPAYTKNVIALTK